MQQATLIKGHNPWRLGNLRGMTYSELSSTLDQVLADSKCPSRLLLLDLGEIYNFQELQDSGIRRLVHNKIGG